MSHRRSTEENCQSHSYSLSICLLVRFSIFRSRTLCSLAMIHLPVGVYLFLQSSLFLWTFLQLSLSLVLSPPLCFYPSSSLITLTTIGRSLFINSDMMSSRQTVSSVNCQSCSKDKVGLQLGDNGAPHWPGALTDGRTDRGQISSRLIPGPQW